MDLGNAAKPIIQHCKGGLEIHHPPLGTVFILEKRTETLRVYRTVVLKAGEVLKQRADYKRLLIRSGTPTTLCNYYPVPLLYVSDAQRREQASKAKRSNPSPRWIKQQRDRINSLLTV